MKTWRLKMSENKIYGEHFMGIPINPPYLEGTLVRNNKGYPPRVRNKEGGTEPYGKWEKKHFSKGIGRPKKYHSEEERRMARSMYARKAYANKKLKGE
jgi:hypothetical protein